MCMACEGYIAHACSIMMQRFTVPYCSVEEYKQDPTGLSKQGIIYNELEYCMFGSMERQGMVLGIMRSTLGLSVLPCSVELG